MALTTIENKKPTIIVGKTGTGKSTQAKEILPNAIVLYADEMKIRDVLSFPLELGIIIEDVHYKPKTDDILNVLRKYRGTIVLTSINQKSIPNEIKNMVKIKRAGKINYRQEQFAELAPRSQEPNNLERDVFSLVLDYLRESDREKVLELIKFNKPSDVQFISWLAENIHPNRLLFIDTIVKRRWSLAYFQEMLAYSHSGKSFTRPRMPQRRTYSKVPSFCRRLGLKGGDERLLRQLFKDEDFAKFAKTRLNNAECRILGLGEKKKRKKKKKTVKPMALGEF
jgi:hypothetical protein